MENNLKPDLDKLKQFMSYSAWEEIRNCTNSDQLIEILQKRKTRKSSALGICQKSKPFLANNKERIWSDFEKIKWGKGKREKRRKDFNELRIVVENLFLNNMGKEIRTDIVTPGLKRKLPNNEFNTYGQVKARYKVYEIISELRRKMREKAKEDDWNGAYIVTLKALSSGGDRRDGWKLTTNRDEILKYLQSERETHENAIKSVDHFEDTLRNKWGW